jgi:ribosomal-protein-alanine N-acetyltransferase
MLRGTMPGALLLADMGVEQGFISLQRAADDAEILNIATVPSARGRGLARALLAEGERLCRDAGARRMFLEVAVDNDPALRLYERAGYARVGERRAYYKRRDGTRTDALILAKDLPGGD